LSQSHGRLFGYDVSACQFRGDVVLPNPYNDVTFLPQLSSACKCHWEPPKQIPVPAPPEPSQPQLPGSQPLSPQILTSLVLGSVLGMLTLVTLAVMGRRRYQRRHYAAVALSSDDE
jgi:hypothetical protein